MNLLAPLSLLALIGVPLIVLFHMRHTTPPQRQDDSGGGGLGHQQGEPRGGPNGSPVVRLTDPALPRDYKLNGRLARCPTSGRAWSLRYPDEPIMAERRRFISSGETSSTWVASVHWWPNGSFTVPVRSP